MLFTIIEKSLQMPRIERVASLPATIFNQIGRGTAKTTAEGLDPPNRSTSRALNPAK
jgi:hypothetical protein